jgi:hypothetical protein
MTTCQHSSKYVIRKTYGFRAILVTATQRFVTDPARVETAIGAGKAKRRQYVSG